MFFMFSGRIFCHSSWIVSDWLSWFPGLRINCLNFSGKLSYLKGFREIYMHEFISIVEAQSFVALEPYVILLFHKFSDFIWRQTFSYFNINFSWISWSYGLSQIICFDSRRFVINLNCVIWLSWFLGLLNNLSQFVRKTLLCYM